MLITLIIFLVIAIIGYIILDRQDNNIRERLGRPRSKRGLSRQELKDQMEEEYEKRHQEEKERMEYMAKINKSPINRFK